MDREEKEREREWERERERFRAESRTPITVAERAVLTQEKDTLVRQLDARIVPYSKEPDFDCGAVPSAGWFEYMTFHPRIGDEIQNLTMDMRAKMMDRRLVVDVEGEDRARTVLTGMGALVVGAYRCNLRFLCCNWTTAFDEVRPKPATWQTIVDWNRKQHKPHLNWTGVDDGWFVTGTFAFKMGEEEHEKFKREMRYTERRGEEKAVRSSSFVPGNIEDAVPLSLVAARMGAPGSRRSDLYMLEETWGDARTVLDAFLYETVAVRFPRAAVMWRRSAPPVLFVEDGETRGLIMPIATGDRGDVREAEILDARYGEREEER